MSPQIPDDLAATVRAAARAVAEGRAPQWVGLRVELPPCDPLAAFEAADPCERFYWERPAEGRALAALGCAATIETEGTKRFAESSERAKELFAALHIAGESAEPGAGPFLVGGFAFSSAASTTTHWRDFPNGRLVLPRITLSMLSGRAWCTVLREFHPGDDAREMSSRLRADLEQFQQFGMRAEARGHFEAARSSLDGADSAPTYRAVADRSHADYRDQVSAALRSIAEGAFEKVVLARSVCLSREGGFEACSLLDTLRRSHPSCAIFAVGRPSSILLGATPECLVRLQDRRMETASVAGSAPRGRSPEEDSQLGRDLLESKKEQAEHAVVVRALKAALSAYCADLDVPESPRLMQLQNIQHLETPIVGTLRGDSSILDLLGAVHPTPAIAGEPCEAALQWIADHENLDRGWYGGPVGFVDHRGGGEFYAALRSSLVAGDEARLFAGAGIVHGSEPESELRETRLKLRTMLAPLFDI